VKTKQSILHYVAASTVCLSSSITFAVPCPRPRLRLPLLFVAVEMFLLLLSITSSTFAGSATWKANPTSGDWNTAANWTPPTVPNGQSDTATFAVSNTTGVSLSANTEVNGIVFNAGASAFTITATPTFKLTISGVGITNNSGMTQNVVGRIDFLNAASAGRSTAFTVNGLIQFLHSSSAGSGAFTIDGGRIIFINTSSAASGTFLNLGSPTFPGSLLFASESTVGNATITTSSSPVSGGFGAQTILLGGATAADGIFFTNGGAFSGANAGALIDFQEDSTAGNSTLIANSGSAVGGGILFSHDSAGGTARVKVFGNGFLDIGGHNAPGVSIGSIQGSGLVLLGALNLTVGSNNRSTNFSGLIQDGGRFGGSGGSLTKVGSGTLVLRNSNAYTGGTTINGGKLVVNNESGSGTGSGPVQVNAGRLGGRGIIAGDVTLGDGSGRGAILAPGKSANTRGTLVIASRLTFNSDGTYDFELNSDTRNADGVIANGVTINSGAQFSFTDVGNGAFPFGTVFTAITNASGTPIAGTFSNLPDGATFTNNGNTYQVNYESGDGNDLTLTVVP
jgi:autotransporter-associated beta strand protein